MNPEDEIPGQVESHKIPGDSTFKLTLNSAIGRTKTKKVIIIQAKDMRMAEDMARVMAKTNLCHSWSVVKSNDPFM